MSESSVFLVSLLFVAVATEIDPYSLLNFQFLVYFIAYLHCIIA